MPKGVPFAEGLSELEYDRLKKNRPYVTRLFRPEGTVDYTPLLERLTQKQVDFSSEESVFINHVVKNLKRDLYVTEHILGNAKYPVPKEAYIIDSPNKVVLGSTFPANIQRNYYYPLYFSDYPKGIAVHGRLHGETNYSENDIHLLHTNAQVDNEYWTVRAGALKTGKNARNLFETHKKNVLSYISQIDAGVKNVNAYQAEKAKKEAAAAAARAKAQAKAQAEKDQRIVQLEAQKASYEKDAAFKKTEFEKALAAQKASSESVMKQMLANFEAQKNNIRTDTERSHQEMLAQHTAELQRQRGAYESQLSASAAELQKQKIMFEDQLTARTIELERQRASYEAQLAARAAEEAKRKQDAEAFQSQLRRKLNIYERGRVGFNFVGTNTPNTQIKGTKIGATKGGRYVAGRIRYDKNGMAVYDTNEGTPDLFLQMIGIAKKMRK